MTVRMKLETTQGRTARFVAENTGKKDAVLGQADLQLSEEQIDDLEAGKIYEVTFTETSDEAEEEEPTAPAKPTA